MDQRVEIKVDFFAPSSIYTSVEGKFVNAWFTLKSKDNDEMDPITVNCKVEIGNAFSHSVTQSDSNAEPVSTDAQIFFASGDYNNFETTVEGDFMSVSCSAELIYNDSVANVIGGIFD